MAFLNKLGSMMRQSISQKGLPWSTDDQTLRDAFSGYGEVTEARVIMDRETGRSRGFGFVSFDSTESASEAVSAMDGQELGGRNVRVTFAEERSRPPRTYNDDYQGSRGYDN
ncbi:hypothetical protein OIU84_025056 [Salix udensis]|uniref:RRM domain-containing protein n=1 Tax=Salix udensis TaxID=889485 RepID=A0AAD6KK03_9ROSI|nr:hypothetical protein OIU84_025056 [Salix udensis]